MASSHKPEDVKVVISLRTTTSSPTFQLDCEDQEPKPFYINIHASIKSSTCPDRPVTLATWKTSLERSLNHSSHSVDVLSLPVPQASPTRSPVWLESALTAFRSTEQPTRSIAPYALGLIACYRGGFARNLREDWDFITLPAPDGDGADKEVMVQHAVPRKDMRFCDAEDPKATMEPRPGEKFVVGPSARGLGTYWWCWGDLATDLKDKKFRSDNWYMAVSHAEDDENEAEAEDFVARDWVESEGENGFGLVMEVENKATVEFV